MSPVPPRARTTVAACGLAVLLTALSIWQGFELLRMFWAPLSDEIRSRAILNSIAPESVAMLGAVGVVTLALCALTIVLIVGLWARRAWAREGAVLVFGTFALTILVLGGAGIAQGAPDAPLALLFGLVDAAVVVLLLLPATADDFDRAAKARQRRAYAPRRTVERLPDAGGTTG